MYLSLSPRRVHGTVCPTQYTTCSLLVTSKTFEIILIQIPLTQRDTVDAKRFLVAACIAYSEVICFTYEL